MTSRDLGVLIAMFGAVLLMAGALVYFGAFSWFGRLPGDFRFERDGVRVFVPFASMLVISIVLSLLFALFRRLF